MADDEWMARDLYRAMPGAPPVREDGWSEAWGDVMDNQHWAFCLLIARTILANRPSLSYPNSR